MSNEIRSSIKCPKCGGQGSVQLKMVRNNYGKEYRYRYVAHYRFDTSKTKSTNIRWCYLGHQK